MNESTYDVIIVGGGIMGCCTAFYLKTYDPNLRVAVVEKDPTYKNASTTLCMANIRTRFSLKENIQISQFAFDKLATFEDDMAVDGDRPAIAFHQEGNLFIHSADQVEDAKRDIALQRELGCRVEWWEPERISGVYPLFDMSGYVGGTFGPEDGHLDAYAVMMAYKAKARSMGALFVRDEVTEILSGSGAVNGVITASGEKLSAPVVVNCTGAWCSDLVRTIGIELPIVPIKRQVFALDVKVKPAGPLPLTILPSLMYFRTEAGDLILLSKSMDDDPVGFDFSWDRDRFMNMLWPELAEFVPAWDTLKLVRGWAGLYAVNTMDGNAVLGEWPELKGFYLANGFSGHGMQQGPAVGRYMAELILKKEISLDLSIFSPLRILENRPVGEGGLV